MHRATPSTIAVMTGVVRLDWRLLASAVRSASDDLVFPTVMGVVILATLSQSAVEIATILPAKQ